MGIMKYSEFSEVVSAWNDAADGAFLTLEWRNLNEHKKENRQKNTEHPAYIGTGSWDDAGDEFDGVCGLGPFLGDEYRFFFGRCYMEQRNKHIDAE